MVSIKTLALIAAGALVLIGSEAKAAPMTEGVFVSYMSQPAGHWNHGAMMMMHFVHWREDNPAWSVRNISWVEKYSGTGGSLDQPILVYDPEVGGMIDDRVPTWKRPTAIPEPTTALAFAGVMGLMAMRRRSM